MQNPRENQPHLEQQTNENDLLYQNSMVETPSLLITDSSQQQYYSFFEGHQPNPNSGFHKLDEETKIVINRKFEADLAMLGCEPQNKYSVYALDQDKNKKSRELFTCMEKTNCCSRNFLSSSCQPFQITISTQQGTKREQSSSFLILERAWQCTFLCVNRPYVTVTLVEDGKNEYLGKITEPYSWQKMELNVYDKDDNHIYTIQENTFLLGALSGCPFDLCSNADFDIKKASGKEILSTLHKQSSGCSKAGPDIMESFILSFPKYCTANEKALLMSAVFFLDYQHFGANSNLHCAQT